MKSAEIVHSKRNRCINHETTPYENAPRRIMKLFIEFYSEHFWLCLIHTVVIILVPMRDIILPLQYSKLIKALQIKNKDVIVPLMLVTLTLISIQVMEFIGDYVDTILIPLLQSFVRIKALRILFDKHETDVKDLEVGDISAKLVRLPSTCTSLFERISVFVIPTVVLHLATIVYFVGIDKYLGLAMMLTVLLLYFIAWLAPYKCEHVAISRDKAYGELHEDIDDVLRNLYSVYGSDRTNEELNRIVETTSTYNSLYQKTMLCAFTYRSFTYPILTCFIITFMMRLNHLITTDIVKVSNVISIFFIVSVVMGSFLSLDDHLKSIVYEFGVFQSSFDFFDLNRKQNSLTPSDELHTQHQQVRYPSSGIGLHNVSFEYPQTHHLVLKDVNVHIEQGDSVAILGDVGSGKSTLLKLLLGYSSPTSGTAYFNGVPFRIMGTKTLRKRVGFVPQMPILFNRSIIENILYGNENKVSRSEAETFLRTTNLISAFENKGLDVKIGKNGSALSGGQRQLLWCVRVMLSDPEVLILDEPSSSIDSKSKQLLKNLLHTYNTVYGKTIIMVTHDNDMLDIARQRLFVSDGIVNTMVS